MAQTDAHFCLIKFLLIKAGFSHWEAEIIAHASELTDHATDHEGICIEGLPPKFQFLFRNGLFEPVCTAHKLINYPRLLFSVVQEKVLISFHFLPPRLYRGGHFSYVTKTKSEFLDVLLETAKREMGKAESWDEYVLALIRFGISLHSYVDMFTHALFSGRYNDENDIEELFVDGEAGDQEIGIIPNIGHGELRNFADLPFAVFTYENYKGIKIRRNNPRIFMLIAKRVYDIFCDFSHGQAVPFSEFEEDLWECFTFKSYDLEERINFWRKKFPAINFDFKEDAWKNSAIERTLTDLDAIVYRYIGSKLGKLWFLFHQAAFDQREFVLQHIKRL